MTFKSTLVAAVEAFVLVWAGGAVAQTSYPAASSATSLSEDAGVSIEEVVVTARRVEENLQKVPIAVTVLNEEALKNHNIVSISDLGELVPSLEFNQSNYGQLGTYVAIRGQRANDLILTQSPSVGVYLDDVYLSSTAGLSAISLTDASSVEVLKGPQGTLYGRNTTGGALKITSLLPELNSASALVRVGGGNESDFRAYGAVSVPLVTDSVALRLVASEDKNSGYGRDLASNTDIGNTDTKSVQGTLRVRPTENFEGILRANYVDARSGGELMNLAEVVPGGALNTIAAFQMGLPLTPSGLSAALGNLKTNYINQPGTNREYNGPLYQHVVQSTESVSLSYLVNEHLTLKSITAIQKFSDAIDGDNDGTKFNTVDGDFDNQDGTQITEELQAIGRLLDDKLNYTAGYFYYRLQADETAFANILYPLTGEVLLNDVHVVDKSNSGYFQTTYRILPVLRGTAGFRYTAESDPLTSYNRVSLPKGTVCNIPPSDLVGTQCAATFPHRDADWSYTAGLDYDLTNTVLLYAKTSRGFKAGGVNQRGSVNGGYNEFFPEQVTDYEVGAKSEFWDRRIRLNAATFVSRYSNIQRTVLVPGVGGSPSTAIQNAAAATIKGFELELTIRPIPRLTLSADGSYVDARYSRYFDAFSGADLSHNVFAGLPRWQGALSATYEYPTHFGSLAGTADISYQSQVNYSPDNNLAPGTSAAFPNGTAQYTTQNGYALANARLTLTLDKSKTTVAAWARNLADRKYFSGGEDQSATLGLAYMEQGRPRTFGVEVSKRF